MTFRSTIVVARLLLLALLAGATAAAEAAPGPPARVRVAFDSATLTQHWGASLEDIRRAVEQRLADHLKTTFIHWEFVSGGAESSPNEALVTFQVAELVPRSLSLVMELRRGPQQAPVRVVERWLGAADLMLGSVPSAETAPADVLTAFRTRLVERQKVELGRWLADNVPVGTGAYWVRGSGTTPRLVLALPWSRYEALRESVFRLVCEWPNQGTATLQSRGPGLALPYRPPPPENAPDPPFDGVVVIVREREFAGSVQNAEQVGAELFELHPRLVYLKEYVPAAAFMIGGQQ